MDINMIIQIFLIELICLLYILNQPYTISKKILYLLPLLRLHLSPSCAGQNPLAGFADLPNFYED